ncbi:MAG: indolepyruvate ferredoxin oxidoreductase subunit alpha [Thermoguttaceae bacterium]|nr:indolepyruvate ferredoxin oxidoreductase subunit alpha [Thermoguttaceae bacterium]
MKKLLSGNESIARGAWESGVKVATGYPGTPSTEILENISRFYKDDIYCEWAPNEKVAFEVAAGAQTTGIRSITTMKHVGLNVAADPLMTLAYIGTVGGFVAIVADDPGMNSSQNEQDTRIFAHFAKVPVIEPSDSNEARIYIREALEISEKFQTPVILRSTTTLSHSRGVVEPEEPRPLNRKASFQKNPQRFIPIPAWARGMRVRLEERLNALSEAASESSLNRIEWGDRQLGIVTSGITYQYVREVFPEASILKLGWSYPFPDRLIREFADGVEQILVIEELNDFLEEHLRTMGIDCFGKKKNNELLVPNIGELNVDVVKSVREKIYPSSTEKQEVQRPTLPVVSARPPVLCPGCPHRGLFYALNKFDIVVTGDIGCYTLGVAPPLNCMDTVICMGGGITMAHGIDKAGNDRKVVGIVGDSTFFHSGITGLMDIVYNKGKAITVVLDNRITAMTGHQDNPGTGKTIIGEPTHALSIAGIGNALGIKNVVEINPGDQKQTSETLKNAIESDEPWLIISKSPCILADRSVIKPTLHVDPNTCKKCGLCIKLGCPAIEKTENGKAKINPFLCVGCKLCKQVCPFHAFKEMGEEGYNVPTEGGNC